MTEPARFDVVECASCHAKIIWAMTGRAKRMPVDAAPVDGGSIQLVDHGPGLAPEARVLTVAQQFGKKGTLHRSHFVTCPHASEWRRPRGAT